MTASYRELDDGAIAAGCWLCPTCGEFNWRFVLCWNCGKRRRPHAEKVAEAEGGRAA